MLPLSAGAQQVVLTDKLYMTQVGAAPYRVELLDAGGLVVGSGTYTPPVVAPLTLTFTGPRTWDWGTAQAGQAGIKLSAPNGAAVPDSPTTVSGAATSFVANVSFTVVSGTYTLRLRNAGWEVIASGTDVRP